MAFDFPNAPFVGQVYTINDVTYTWNGYAWDAGGVAGPPGAASDYVLKAGDTMTGYLTLSADPVQPLHAATKQYIDAKGGLPPVGVDGQALVAQTGIATWGAPIHGGSF